jgi:hypothetical protein
VDGVIGRVEPALGGLKRIGHFFLPFFIPLRGGFFKQDPVLFSVLLLRRFGLPLGNCLGGGEDTVSTRSLITIYSRTI